MAERAVGYVSDVELAGCGDQAVGFVEGFEGGVLCLDCIDFGDYRKPLVRTDPRVEVRKIIGLLELALRSVAAEHSDRPMYFVLPALRMESRAGMEPRSSLESPSDLLGSMRWR